MHHDVLSKTFVHCSCHSQWHLPCSIITAVQQPVAQLCQWHHACIAASKGVRCIARLSPHQACHRIRS